MSQDFVIAHTDVRMRWEPPEIRFYVKGPRFFRRWADRALRWLFKASRAEVLHTDTLRTFRRAPGETILDRMHLNQRDMMRLYNREAAYLFCGPEIESDLLRQASIMSLGPLNAHIGGPQGVRVSGVEVIMVPWMTGALLVPDWRKP